jgi:hypothetical protein
VIHLPKRIKESPHALTLFMANLRDIPLDLLLQDELQGLTFDLASLVRKIIKTLHSDVAHLLALLLLFEHQDLAASFRVLNFKPRKGFYRCCWKNL